MALDYSKLTTAELEAIANDDYRKLSNKTLRALSNEPEPSAFEKFKEPFKDVSVKDFAEKSFLAPALQVMQSVTPFGMLRRDLATQNLQQGSQNLVGKGGQMAQGLANIVTNPVESAQKAYTAVTENPAGVAGEMAKGLLYDPQFLIGSGLGTVAEKGLMSAGRGVKNVVGGAGDIAGGAIGRGTGYIAKPGEAPVGYQVPSSRAPLRDTVMLPEDMARFERGEMPYGQMPTEVPIQQLPRNALERTALKLSGGEIPYQGQAARAFGERLGETYRNPITAGLDIGSLFIPGNPGIPLYTAGKGLVAGVQGAADALLARRGLDPNLPTRLADYQSGARPMPGTPPAPAPGPVNPASMNYPLTVQGPGQQLPPSVIPMSGAPRQVNIEGQSYKLPYQIDVANSQTARPQQTPAQQSQQLAAQKLQEVQALPLQQQVMAQGGKGADILAQIKARQAAGQQPTVMNTAPVAGPIAPTAIQSLSNQRWTPAEKLALERANLQNNPAPAMSAADEAAMAKQVAESTKSSNEAIISDFATKGNSDKIDMIGQTIPVDKGKDAYNGSPATKGMATYLLKNGVDSIPVLPGMTESQTVHAIAEQMKGINRVGRRKPDVLGMQIGEPKPTGALEQSIVAKRSFNGDLQKYRYGTEKSPLTLQEYNHLKNSEFIDKQNTRDILMGMRPDLTEYSIWYKDKSGKIQNIQTYGDEFKKK